MTDLERVISAVLHHDGCDRCRRRFVDVVLFRAAPDKRRGT